jgi:hypothetical protein
MISFIVVGAVIWLLLLLLAYTLPRRRQRTAR